MVARVPLHVRMHRHSKRLSCGCRVWTGTKVGEYGQIQIDRKNWLVHRLAWTRKHGPIPEGMDVLHRCDTPACFETDHLFLGTHQENMDDMRSKGRDNRVGHKGGETHHYSKLSDQQIVEIRTLASDQSAVQLSARYDVTPNHIRRIIRGVSRA